MVTLLAPEFLLHRRLYAGLPGVVPGAVLVRMLLDVGRVDLGHITQEIASGIERIIPYASGQALEARELVLHLGELHVGLRRNLLEHGHGLVAYPPAVPAVLGHLVPYQLRVHIQNLRQHQRVEGTHLARGHEYVIRHLVAHDDAAVPVVYGAAGRVYDVINHRVVHRVNLVPAVYDLDIEQLDYQYRGENAESG